MSGETVRRFTDREIADAYTKFRMAIKGQIVQVEDYVRASDYDRQVKWLTEENARLAHDLDAASVDQKNALIALVREARSLLADMWPYTDVLICYASTVTEHPPNGWDARIDAFLIATEEP